MSRRLLYIEPTYGIAGDMFVASLIDLGVPLSHIQDQLKHLDIAGYEISCSTVRRGPFAAKHFQVSPNPEVESDPSSLSHPHQHHAHSESHFPGHPHRKWSDIRALLERSKKGLGEPVVTNAIRVFHCLALAEANVHGTAIEDVVFHEVGGVDSIVDIVASCIALEYLNIDFILSGALPMSSGHVDTAHGRIALPAPATLRVLTDWPVTTGREGLEQVTPTGAAIVAALAKPGRLPSCTLRGTGVGAGTANPKGWPNILRLVLGEQAEDASAPEVDVISAHMDDLSGEHLPGLLNALIESGAVDAFATPVIMKKGRSGLWVQALAKPEDSQSVSETMLIHGSTFGLRRHRTTREVLERWHESVDTPHGRIRVKIGARNGKILHASPEFEDVRRAAESTNTPIPRVHSEAVTAWTTKKRNRQ